MKSRVLVGSLAVMLLLLTGCGGTQTLVCTQTQEEDGMTMTTEMNVSFQNDEASEFTMTADMKVDDTYIDYMDQFESIMEESFSTFFVKCVCPDFVAEHIVGSKNNPADRDLPLISPVFNTSTMYYAAYAQLGYLGMFMLFIIQAVFLYIIFLSTTPRQNPFYTATASIASAVVVLNAFSNMWVFSAISFPIVWGFICYFFCRLKW